jgi:hypothetical protein
MLVIRDATTLGMRCSRTKQHKLTCEGTRANYNGLKVFSVTKAIFGSLR